MRQWCCSPEVPPGCLNRLSPLTGEPWAVRKLAAVSKGRPGPYKLAHPDVPPNLLALPLFHSGGQQTLLFAFYVGRPLLLMKKFNAAGVVELVGRYRIDNLFLMPTMVYDLVGLKEPVSLETVRAVLVAGQRLDDQLGSDSKSVSVSQSHQFTAPRDRTCGGMDPGRSGGGALEARIGWSCL